MEKGTTESPNGGEDEVEFVQVLGAVGRGVLGGEDHFQQVAQHLDHRLLWYRDDRLEPVWDMVEFSITKKNT